jgi:superfamily II DNA/RNA helicase
VIYPGEDVKGFSVTVQHACNLARVFTENGIPVAVLHAGSKDREEILALFAQGRLMGIWNCGILTEGYDCPDVSCIIMARPTQSATLYVQCVGRGARILPEDEGRPYAEWQKKEFLVVDITDNSSKHRLEALNLEMAVGVDIEENENLKEALTRKEQEEEEERIKRERKLKVNRYKDEVIPLVGGQNIVWDVNEAGYVTAVFGREKHRIALIPAKNNGELFGVAGALAPNYERKWLDTNLRDRDGSMKRAEDIARDILLAEEKERLAKRLERKGHWTQDPASEDQIKLMCRLKISYERDDLGNCTWTKGRASMAISTFFANNPRRSKATSAFGS